MTRLAPWVAPAALVASFHVHAAATPCRIDIVPAADKSKGQIAMSSAISTTSKPARVPVTPLITAAAGAETPHLIQVELGSPTGVATPEAVVAMVDLLVLDQCAAVKQRVPLGPVSFFGATPGEPSRYVFDLSTAIGLDAEGLAAVASGDAAVEVRLTKQDVAAADLAVPVLGAAMMATPAP
jgi:hypothetical protein